MKPIACGIFAFALIESTVFAQQCAAPIYQPPACAAPAQTEAAPRPESGTYVRGPEAGEYESGATSLGIKGFGLTLPSISFQGPELRLPHFTKYRRNPSFNSESSRAPFVRGPVSEFNQVPRQGNTEAGLRPESNLRPESTPSYQCIPPSPCSAEIERKLRDDLATKENELREMRDRLARCENILNRLAESQQPQDAPTRAVRTSRRSQIVEAGYSEEDEHPVARENVGMRSNRSRKPEPIPAEPATPTSRKSESRTAKLTDANAVFSDRAPSDELGLGVWVREPSPPPVGNR